MRKMEGSESKSHRCQKSSSSPTNSPVSPSLNLMEQLLLVKMERQSSSEKLQQQIICKPKSSLLRTDSIDSQNSTSTFSSFLSNDSGSSNRYCRCDDCLLGIADKFQQNQIDTSGRQKV